MGEFRFRRPMALRIFPDDFPEQRRRALFVAGESPLHRDGEFDRAVARVREIGGVEPPLHDLNRLEYFDHNDEGIVRGWRSILVTDGDQPYMDKWWVPGLIIGYEHSFIHQAADFLKSLQDGNECHPTFRDAYETQKVCEAVIESAKSRSWKDTKVEWVEK